MEWILVAVLGAVIGLVFSPIAKTVQIPVMMTVTIGAVCAVLGAAVDEAAGFEPFGRATDFIVGGVVSFGCLLGMVLAFVLTKNWQRAES